MAESTPSVSREIPMGEFSDFTIQCGHLKLKVHRFILAKHSDPLGAMIRALGSAGTFIDLAEDEPRIVSRMIQFMYCDSYDSYNDQTEPVVQVVPTSPDHPAKRIKIDPEASTEPESLLITNTKVYMIGDKYQIPALRTFAIGEFNKAAKVLWSTMFFPQSIALLFENEKLVCQALKAQVIEIAYQHLEELLASVEFGGMLNRHGEVGRWLLMCNLRHQKEKEREDAQLAQQAQQNGHAIVPQNAMPGLVHPRYALPVFQNNPTLAPPRLYQSPYISQAQQQAPSSLVPSSVRGFPTPQNVNPSPSPENIYTPPLSYAAQIGHGRGRGRGL